MTKKEVKETTDKKTKPKKEKKPKRTREYDPVGKLIKVLSKKPKLLNDWSKDPINKAELKELVQSALTFMKLRIACDNRHDSPTETNEAKIERESLQIVLAIADSSSLLEEQLKKSMIYFVRQSEIGDWLLSQPGLKSGWLAAYVLAQFPDIYDAGRCLKCDIHLHRQYDGTFVHPAPPKRDDDEKSKNHCEFDGKVMEPGEFYMHEKKPSSFVAYAGLNTVIGYTCPVCRYNLKWNNSKKCYTHPLYVNLPKSIQKCTLAGKEFKSRIEGALPTYKNYTAIETLMSPKKTGGQKLTFNSALRAKLLGPKGLADMFIMLKMNLMIKFTEITKLNCLVEILTNL